MSKKPQTKIGRVQGMLKKPKGASLAAICKATGWCPLCQGSTERAEEVRPDH
jgi:hypothetical protein